jgi:pimeloyl-ACP methyl ester carboxylesterase
VGEGILSAAGQEAPTIRLRDGRALAYAECGDPDGFPVISCHGTPSCRLPGGWEAAAEAAGARFVQPDRPGYGRSDFHPNLTLLEWARDVAELAESLGLDRFAVVGTSGGGPYAAACGYALPERVGALALVCGVGPFWDVPEVDACATEQTGSWIRELIDLARRDPDAAVAHALEECELDAAMVARDPAEWMQYWFENDDMPEADRELAARPEVRAWSFASIEESLHGGIEGYVQDELVLTVRPWGFRAEEISVPTYIWHGERDTLAPVGGARYLAAVIPGSSARFFPEEGHGISGRHGEEILRALVDPA